MKSTIIPAPVLEQMVFATFPETTYPNGSARAFGLDLNMYYDFAVPGRVTPYLGAGVGIARLRLNDGVFLDESTGTANLQATAGINVAVHHRLNVFVDVRAQRLIARQLTAMVTSPFALPPVTSDVGLTNRALVAGLRVAF